MSNLVLLSCPSLEWFFLDVLSVNCVRIRGPSVRANIASHETDPFATAVELQMKMDAPAPLECGFLIW